MLNKIVSEIKRDAKIKFAEKVGELVKFIIIGFALVKKAIAGAEFAADINIFNAVGYIDAINKNGK